MTYAEILNIAQSLGISHMRQAEVEDYATLSDGCSGGLSRLYALAGRRISCHRACVAHDFLYGWGGDRNARRQADKLLRICAAQSGQGQGLIRSWRRARAWIMWATVRLFAQSHWTEES